MERIIQNILISVAVLAASIMVFCGIKKFRIKQSRQYGIFITTLLITLSLAEFNSFCYAGENSDGTAKPITQESESNQSNRINELNQFEEWKNFKAFWKKLDQNQFKYSTYDSLRSELKEFHDGFYNLQSERKIDFFYELLLLEEISLARINYKFFGSDVHHDLDEREHSVSRMGRPRPRAIIRKDPVEESIHQLEQKIDKLTLVSERF